MFLLVLMVWAVANVIHPAFIMLILGEFGFTFSEYFVLFLFSLLFSLPSLAFSWLFIWMIGKLNNTPVLKFLCFVASIPAMILLNVVTLLILIGEPALNEAPTSEDIILFVPAVLCTMIGSGLFYKKFEKVFTLRSNYETDPV